MNYYTNKIIEMSFTPLLSFSRKRESRRRLRESWEPEDKKILDARLKTSGMTENQARNDRQEHICTNKKGVTLIELVITMVLIGIIAYIVATALSTGITAYFTTDFRKEALDQARIAMERITREIRNVSNNQSVCTAATNSIGFYDTSSPAKLIEFQLSGNNIQRRENAGTWYNLATGNPINLNFTYYDASGNLAAPTVGCTPPTTTDIKLIRIDIAVTVSTESVTLQSEVWPRSL